MTLLTGSHLKKILKWVLQQEGFKFFIMPDSTLDEGKEYWIIDDKGSASMIYLDVHGTFKKR